MSKQPKACPQASIGGQAVMEGVMMRSPDMMAITVRRPAKKDDADQSDTLVVFAEEYHPLSEKHKWMGKPFIRGAVNMATMLYDGMRILDLSTKMLGVLEEEPTPFEKKLAEKTGKGVDKIIMGVAMVLAICLSLALFVALPAGAESLLKSWGMGAVGYTLIGGILKIALLIGYMSFCSAVPDVRRTFEYHGAEHRTVYCHEHSKPLTPANAMQEKNMHPRCGTAFLFIVFMISILLFLVLNVVLPISNFFLRFGFHLLMLPIVAGVSYEVLKGLARSESKVSRILRWPGMQLQRLTTRDPDEKQLECAIVSMNVCLYGLPADASRTEEGWVLLKDYRESDPAFRKEQA